MRRILILGICVLTLFSCSRNKEEIIIDNISEALKSGFENPDSFEFVGMTIEKVFSVKERKEIITPDYIQSVLEFSKEFSSPKILDLTKKEYNFLQTQTDENAEAVYYIDFIAKVKNDLGTIEEKTFSATVLNDKEYTVIRAE